MASPLYVAGWYACRDTVCTELVGIPSAVAIVAGVYANTCAEALPFETIHVQLSASLKRIEMSVVSTG